jgi:hypothetical protein
VVYSNDKETYEETDDDINQGEADKTKNDDRELKVYELDSDDDYVPIYDGSDDDHDDTDDDEDINWPHDDEDIY